MESLRAIPFRSSGSSRGKRREGSGGWDRNTCTSSPEPARNCTTQQLPRARWSSVEAREPKKRLEIWSSQQTCSLLGRPWPLTAVVGEPKFSFVPTTMFTDGVTPERTQEPAGAGEGVERGQ